MVDRHEDLFTFQLTAALNQKVWELTSRPPASDDQRFTANIRDAANSMERNVPEGFGRFSPGDFAHFLDFSRASAEETKNQLRKGFKAGYFTKEEFEEADALAGRALDAIAGFQRYLRSPRARRNAERIRERLRTTFDRPKPTRTPPKARAPEREERNERPERNERNERREQDEPDRTVRTSRTPRTSGPFE